LAPGKAFAGDLKKYTGGLPGSSSGHGGGVIPLVQPATR
jgi:hypothetical protein